MEEIIKAIEDGNVEKVYAYLEGGHFCEEYYLILSAKHGSLELFKLIEKYLYDIAPILEDCSKEAIAGSNLDIIRYLVEDKKVNLYCSCDFIHEVKSEEMLDYLVSIGYKQYVTNGLIQAMKSCNLKFIEWYKEKYGLQDNAYYARHYNRRGVIKYFHDQKIGYYARCDNNCVYCCMNKMSVIWDAFREQGNYVDWVSRDIIETIQEELLKRPVYQNDTNVGSWGYTGATGNTGPIGPTGPTGAPGLIEYTGYTEWAGIIGYPGNTNGYPPVTIGYTGAVRPTTNGGYTGWTGIIGYPGNTNGYPPVTIGYTGAVRPTTTNGGYTGWTGPNSSERT